MRTLIVCYMLALPLALLAGPIVEVRTSLGVFYLELYEHAAPVSSENFLKYVTQGRYDDSFVYGAADSSFVRGGGYTFSSCPDGVRRIVEEPPITFEQTDLSNISGSISMVQSSTSGNSATSDWIINLDNNFGFDDASTGYAPFGEVVGNGLEVVWAIALANPAQYSDPLDSMGTDFFAESVNCQTPEQSDHIWLAMTLVNGDGDLPSGRYLSADNELQINILLSDGSYIRMPFDVEMHEDGEITVTARSEDSTELEQPLPNMARYNDSTGALTLRSLEIDGVVLFENVSFLRTENSSSTFKLVSFEEI
ncbi:MAG: peptidylprolyl isomerase [Pseudomonadales bacterium]|nr:peptidylprolyl isomerase [Pseudomonadales bacterium]